MRIRELALVLAVVFTAACKEEESARDAVEPLVAADCGWRFACCSPGELGYDLGPFTTDVDDCTDRTIAALESGQLSASSPLLGIVDLLYLSYDVEVGRIDLDEDAVSLCADRLAERECNIIPDPDLVPDPIEPERCVRPEPDPCAFDQIVRGRQDVGDECNPAVGFECKSGLRCVDYGYIGICARVAGIGEYCVSDSNCMSELFCDYTTGLCAEGGGVGSACSFIDPLNPVPGTELVRCAVGLSCDPGSLVCVDFCAPGAACADDLQCPEEYVCALGRCRLPGDLGAPCARNEECISEICDPNTATCQVRGPVGSFCSYNEDCSSGFCSPNSGTCERGSDIGGPCPTYQNSECIGGWCDSTDPAVAPVCRGFVGAGELCSQAQACDPDDLLTCIDGVCRETPLPNGVTCSDGTQCQSMLCWNGTCQEGAAVGETCDTYGTTKPCGAAAYCLVAGISSSGVCSPKRGTGELCEADAQCWGLCEDRWGVRMCNASPALGAAICDGM